MSKLLFKEFALSAHASIYVFFALAAMLLIPSYPYYVAFIYTCLGIFFTFQLGRENNDVMFTACLPIKKRDAVKARCLFVGIIELIQIIIAVPFAVLSIKINPEGGNAAGIEPNVAFFGFVFIMFAIFNSIMIPSFYKTAYKIGRGMLIAGIAVMLYITVLEASVHFVPFMIALDTVEPHAAVSQIPILLGGIALFVLSIIFSYYKGASHFEKVDL